MSLSMFLLKISVKPRIPNKFLVGHLKIKISDEHWFYEHCALKKDEQIRLNNFLKATRWREGNVILWLLEETHNYYHHVLPALLTHTQPIS